ncbi:MAG: T9SS type A sorting domain-containing protein [Calditrichae bacterium]|nr:T9SS type A sorting domain-containing protein [Calditrichia bacterium]
MERDFGLQTALESAAIADDFNLKQNYPNPFNPATRIEYSLPHSAYVQLKIFNALGSEVATLTNKRQSPGTYVLEFDAGLLCCW